MLARLEEFYLLDQNAIPWEYVIRPRNGMNQVEWTESVERPLLASMERITDEMGLSSMKKWELGIGNSATHQEIIMGVMKAASREHIHAFRRIVRNPHDIAIPESFQDVPDPKVFNYRDELNAGLIEVLGEPGRAGSNFHQYTLEWEDYGVFKETGLDQFAKGVLEALETALEATVSSQLAPCDSENDAHSEFGEIRCKQFFGRMKELNQIGTYLRSGNDGRSLLLYGKEGYGKTAVMAKAVRDMEEQQTTGVLSKDQSHESIQIIERYIGATAESTDLESLLKDIFRSIKIDSKATTNREQLGIPKESESEQETEEPSDDAPTLKKQLRKRFGEAGKIYIFLDGVDQCRIGGPLAPLSWLFENLPRNVRVVVSAAIDDPMVAKTHLMLGNLNKYALLGMGPLDEHSAIDWLHDWPWKHRRLQEDQIEQVLDGFRSNGTPLWMQIACIAAREIPSRDKDSLQSLPKDTQGLIRHVLRGISREVEFGDILTKHVLGYLGCAQHGLSESELVSLISKDKSVIDKVEEPYKRKRQSEILPHALWVPVLDEIRPFLGMGRSNGFQTLQFHHKSYQAAVKAEYLSDDQFTATLHKRLADYFLERAGAKDERQWEAEDPRAFAECVKHVIHSDNKDSAIDLLTNFGFIFHKARLGLIDSLITDYEILFETWRIDDSQPVRTWKDFIKEKAHLLRRGDGDWDSGKILFQLALEHAVTSPVTTAAEEWRRSSRPQWKWLQNAFIPYTPPESYSHAVLEGHMGSVRGGKVLDAERIVTWSEDGTISIWDLSGHRLREIRPSYSDGFFGQMYSISGLLVLEDGKLLTWTDEKAVRIWDSETGNCLGLYGPCEQKIDGVVEISEDLFASWSNWDERKWGGTYFCEETQMHEDSPDYREGGSILCIWSRSIPTDTPMQKLENSSVHIYDVLPWGQSMLMVRRCGMRWDNQIADHDDVDRRIMDRTPSEWALVDPMANEEGMWFTDQYLPISTIVQYIDPLKTKWPSKQIRIIESGFSNRGQVVRLGGPNIDAAMLTSSTIVTWANNQTWSENENFQVWTLGWGNGNQNIDIGLQKIRGVIGTGTNSIAAWSSINYLMPVQDPHTKTITRPIEPGKLVLHEFQSSTNRVLATSTINRMVVKGAIDLSGDLFASWTSDATITVWEAKNGTMIRVLRGHQHPILGCEMLPNGMLLSWSVDASARIWDIPRLKGISRVLIGQQSDAEEEQHTARIRGAIRLSLDRVITWTNDQDDEVTKGLHGDGTIRIWNSLNGKCEINLTGNVDEILGAFVDSTGCLCTWGPLRTWMPANPWRVWEDTRGQLSPSPGGHRGPIQGAILVSLNCLLTWSSDATLRLWDRSGVTCTWFTHAGNVRGGLECEDGRILSWSDGGIVHIWSKGQTNPACLSEHFDDCILGTHSFAKMGLLFWTQSGSLWAWDGHSSVSQCILHGFYSKVLGTELSEDGDLFLWTDDRAILVIPEDGINLRFLGHSKKITAIAHLSRWGLCSWSDDGSLRLWNVHSGRQAAIFEDRYGEKLWCLSDGRLFEAESQHHSEGRKLIRDSKTEEILLELDFPKSNRHEIVTGLIEHPDGFLVLYGGERIWAFDPKEGRLLWKSPDHSSVLVGCMLLQDGQILAWPGHWSQTFALQILDPGTGTPISSLDGHTHPVRGAFQLTNGLILTWADQENGFWLRDIQNNTQHWLSESEQVKGISEAAPGFVLVWTATTVSIWNPKVLHRIALRSGKDNHAPENLFIPVPKSSITGARYLSDGRVAVWSKDEIQIWDPRENDSSARLNGHKGAILGVFEHEDLGLVTCDEYRTLRIWSLSEHRCKETYRNGAHLDDDSEAAWVSIPFEVGDVKNPDIDDQRIVRTASSVRDYDDPAFDISLDEGQDHAQKILEAFIDSDLEEAIPEFSASAKVNTEWHSDVPPADLTRLIDDEDLIVLTTPGFKAIFLHPVNGPGMGSASTASWPSGRPPR
jgi:WD40 repeat protein